LGQIGEVCLPGLQVASVIDAFMVCGLFVSCTCGGAQRRWVFIGLLSPLYLWGYGVAYLKLISYKGLTL